MPRKVREALSSLCKSDTLKRTTVVFLLFFVMLFIFAITQSQYRTMKIEVGEKSTEAPLESNVLKFLIEYVFSMWFIFRTKL